MSRIGTREEARANMIACIPLGLYKDEAEVDRVLNQDGMEQLMEMMGDLPSASDPSRSGSSTTDPISQG